MSIHISPNLPANVVEIGNEITQAKLDAINNGYAPTSGNPFTTVSYLTSNGYLTDAPSDGSQYARKNGAWAIVTGGGGGSSTWGSITGTLSAQTDLNTALGLKAPISSPTFTGTVTIPAGASISGYATQSYVNSQGFVNSSTLTATLSSYATQSWVTSQNYATQSFVTTRGYLTDSPSDGSEYVRKNGAWSIASALSDSPSDGFSYVRNMGNWVAVGTSAYQTIATEEWVGTLGYQTSADVSTYVTGLGYQTASDVTTALGAYLPLAGGAMTSAASITLSNGTVDSYVGADGFGVELTADTTQQSWHGYNEIYVKNGGTGVTVNTTGITFPDSSVQTTAYTGSSYSADQIKADFIINNLAGWYGYYGMFNFSAIPLFLNNISSVWGLSDGTNSAGFSYGYSSGSQMALYFSNSIGYSTISAYVNSTYSTYSVS